MSIRRLAWWLFPSYLLFAVSAVALVALYAYFAVDRFHTERTQDEMRKVALLAARPDLNALPRQVLQSPLPGSPAGPMYSRAMTTSSNATTFTAFFVHRSVT